MNTEYFTWAIAASPNDPTWYSGLRACRQWSRLLDEIAACAPTPRILAGIEALARCAMPHGRYSGTAWCSLRHVLGWWAEAKVNAIVSDAKGDDESGKAAAVAAVAVLAEVRRLRSRDVAFPELDNARDQWEMEEVRREWMQLHPGEPAPPPGTFKVFHDEFFGDEETGERPAAGQP